MYRSLIVSLALAASTVALAESNTITGRPGFFKPSLDGNSSISRIVSPEQLVAEQQKAQEVAMATSIPTPPAPAPMVVPVPMAVPSPETLAAPAPETPAETVKKVEPELDRAEAEHREMTARSVEGLTVSR